MSILRDIQTEILDSSTKLGSILLKLRLLASRLDSEPLADWVKYETEGYPQGVSLPEYRYVGVSYRGTFSGPFGSGIQDAPIPLLIIEKYAGKNWVRKEVRESIAVVDDLAEAEELGLDASNLILRLQGKIYKNFACNSVTGTISNIEMRGISNTVRSRVLELTLEIEKRIPDSINVTLQQKLKDSPVEKQMVTEIFQQTVFGGVAR